LSNGVVTLFYVTVALTAYLVFGDNVLSPVLLSFEPSFFLDASYMLIALHVLLTAPMLLMSVSNEIEKDISTSDSENSESRFFTRSVLRGVIIIIASTTVVSLPNFEKLVSFFGSMTSSILSFVLPVAFYVQLYKNQITFSFMDKLSLGLILVIGMICFIAGSYFSGRDLLSSF
ncbi:Amino acid transporter ANTL2, partial [Smittium culicis]